MNFLLSLNNIYSIFFCLRLVLCGTISDSCILTQPAENQQIQHGIRFSFCKLHGLIYILTFLFFLFILLCIFSSSFLEFIHVFSLFYQFFLCFFIHLYYNRILSIFFHVLFFNAFFFNHFLKNFFSILFPNSPFFFFFFSLPFFYF